MRKSPITITLKRIKRTVGHATWENDYEILSISGAITLGAYNGEVFRAGDTVTEKQAERFTASYLVKVTK